MKTIVDIAMILSIYVCYGSQCNKCEVSAICKTSTSYCPAVMVARERCKMLETGVYYG